MEDCNKLAKTEAENQQTDSQSAQTIHENIYNAQAVVAAKELVEDKKRILTKKEQAKKCNTKSTKNFLKQAFCRCPTCSPLNLVKDKVSGKNYFKIPFTNFKIPRFDHLFDKVVTFDSNRRSGEVCGACGGKKVIQDVNDDSAKYEQVAQMIENNSDKIMEAEAKLGMGGTRTTIIQGSDLLFVGLGFNNNKTHEIIPGGAIAPSMRGGKIPQQNATQVNAVVGKQGSLAWPQQVGNYTIKCANKFSVLAGAGGITIATPGPLTFSAGLMKFVGPSLSLGSSTGPLSLEGDSVSITGKAISITPTGGELFVKGNINNTGNITTQGHAHFESVSFAKGSCVGSTKTTYMANGSPDVTITQPAVWSYKAVIAALMDLQAYYQTILADMNTSAFRLLSPKENQNIADRLAAMVKLAMPYEILPTGWILPGTPISLVGVNMLATYDDYTDLGVVVQRTANITATTFTAVVATPIVLNNFPHVHGVPETMHNHEVMLPDMDYTSGSTSALRSKVLNGVHESGVPSDPTKDTMSRLMEVKKIAIEFTYAATAEAMKLMAKLSRLMG